MKIALKKITGNINNIGQIDWQSLSWNNLTKVAGPLNYQTRFKTAYSDSGLYFLVDCEDKKFTVTDRDNFSDLYRQDVVEIFLWPDEKKTLYFEYEISPTNKELPLLVPNNRGIFMGWLPWHYTGKRKIKKRVQIVKINGKISGWQAEIFIPFALLQGLGNVPPKSGSFWRANICRIDYDLKPRTLWSWSAETGAKFHNYKDFGMIEFN